MIGLRENDDKMSGQTATIENQIPSDEFYGSLV